MEKKIVWKKAPIDTGNEEGARCANSHGHFLYIRFDERTNKWYKCIDNHYRGNTELLEVAKRQLEREAAGEGDSWGEK